MDAIVLTHHNIDDKFSELEMFLRSFFNESLTLSRQTLVLENNCFRLVYSRVGLSEQDCDDNVAFSLLLYLLCAEADCGEYHIAFADKPFAIKRPIAPNGFKVSNLDTFLANATIVNSLLTAPAGRLN